MIQQQQQNIKSQTLLQKILGDIEHLHNSTRSHSNQDSISDWVPDSPSYPTPIDSPMNERYSPFSSDQQQWSPVSHSPAADEEDKYEFCPISPAYSPTSPAYTAAYLSSRPGYGYGGADSTQ